MMAGTPREAFHFAYCEACGKRGYFSRRVARRALREQHPGEKGMRPYRCPVRDGLWHLGHLPNIVRRRGVVAADDVFQSHYRQQRGAST